jgi:tetratricopeptide (TPR) repeat protein
MQAPLLRGRTVVLVGRTQFLTRDRARRLIERAGGRLGNARDPTGTVAVFGARGLSESIRDGSFAPVLARLREAGAEVCSEIGLLRAIGILPALPSQMRSYMPADIARAARLPPSAVEMLAASGVIEPAGGPHGFGDVRAAKAIATLLAEGRSLPALVSVAAALRRSSGELDVQSLQQAAATDSFVEATAQGVLAFSADLPTLDDVIDRAEQADEHGLDREGLRWWAAAVAAAPRDATLRFNLGCALLRCRHDRDAELQFVRAAHIEPSMADAWFNAAHAARRRGDAARTRLHLDRCIEADPYWTEPLMDRMRLAAEDEDWTVLSDGLRRLDPLPLTPPEAAFATRARQLLQLAEMRRQGTR